MKYTYYLSHKKTQAEITTVKQVNNKCEKKIIFRHCVVYGNEVQNISSKYEEIFF